MYGVISITEVGNENYLLQTNISEGLNFDDLSLSIDMLTNELNVLRYGEKLASGEFSSGLLKKVKSANKIVLCYEHPVTKILVSDYINC